MNKTIFCSMIMLFSSMANAAVSYECNRYDSNGEYLGFVNVSADSNAEAVQLAEAKFREINVNYVTVKCE